MANKKTEKLDKIIFSVLVILILIGVAIAFNLSASASKIKSVEVSTFNAEETETTEDVDIEYHHLDIRIINTYDLNGTDDATADVNNVYVTKSDGTVIAIQIDTDSTNDETDNSLEYKSVEGHSRESEGVELYEGDIISVSLKFTYQNLNGDSITKLVPISYTLTESNNLCSRINGVLQSEVTSDAYGYDIEIDIQDYIDSEYVTYLVNYYYQNSNGEYDLYDQDASRVSTIGALVELNSHDITPVLENYSLNRTKTFENADSNLQYTVPSDGSLVISVYFDLGEIVDPDYNYTINYYYDGVLDSSETITGTAKEYEKIQYTEKTKNNTYELDTEKTPNTSLVITSTDENVLNIYYKTIVYEYGYTVEYYYDNVIDSTKTETISATYQDIINTYTDKNITGYELDKEENLPLTITENEETNVIKIYYTKIEDSTDATVEIKYVDKNTGEEITDTVTHNGVVGDVIDITDDKIEIPGYTLIEEPENTTTTMTEEKQTYTYYYAANTTVTIKYIDKDTNTVLDETTINGYEGKEYTTEQKSFDNYEFVEVTGNTSGKMTKDKIVVNYYYTKTGETSTPEPETSTTPTVPKTGDTTPVIVIAIIIFTLILNIIIELKIRKNK